MDYLLLILIAAAFALALRHILKSRNQKNGCSGSCEGCMGCGYRKQDRGQRMRK